MKKLTWTIVLIFLLLAGPVTAQFYRYTDQNGNLRFTDDLNKVPAEQRATIRGYRELGKDPAPSSPETAPEPAKPPAAKAEPNKSQTNNVPSTGADGAVSNEELRRRIDKMIEQLEAEYLALTKGKDALARSRDSMKTREELAAYNKSVDAFNQRAENYESMSSQLKILVDEYNALLPAKNTKSKKPD
jgi:hypothetical protein